MVDQLVRCREMWQVLYGDGRWNYLVKEAALVGLSHVQENPIGEKTGRTSADAADGVLPSSSAYG